MWNLTRSLRLLGVAASLALIVALAGDVGSAGDNGAKAADMQAEPEAAIHCAIVLAPLEEGQTSSDVVSQPKCFATFAEAMQYGSGGVADSGAFTNPQSITDSALNAALKSQALIGIDYKDAYYNSGGGTYSYFVDNPSGCTTGYGYGMDTMPGGWDNVVSSAQPYTGCNTWWHYDLAYHPSYSAKIDCSPCSSMGAMDNATSSEEWGP